MQTISQRLGTHREREGLLVRDIENRYLPLEALDDSVMSDPLGHCITDRIGVGPQAGRASTESLDLFRSLINWKSIIATALTTGIVMRI